MPESPDERREFEACLREHAEAQVRERARRERVRLAEALKGHLEACSEFVHDWGAFGHRMFPEYPDDWADKTLLGQSHLTDEYTGAGDPTWDDWDEANRVVCETWVRYWCRAAWVIRLLDLNDVVTGSQPDGAIDRLIHRRFAQLLKATSWSACEARGLKVASDLRERRAEVARGATPKLRYQFNRYFREWLLPRVSAAIEPLVEPPTNPQASGPTELAVEPVVVDAAKRNPVVVAHADDFSWLSVGPRRFRFTRLQQARVIEALYKEWVKADLVDGATLRREFLAERADSNADMFRIQKVFSGNNALFSILRSPARGLWALYLNEDEEAQKKGQFKGQLKGSALPHSGAHGQEEGKPRDTEGARQATSRPSRVAPRRKR